MRPRRLAGGASVIEAAVVLPVLFILFLGTVDLLLFYGVRAAALRAAQEALTVAVASPAIYDPGDSAAYEALARRVDEAGRKAARAGMIGALADGVGPVRLGALDGVAFRLVRPSAASRDELERALASEPVRIETTLRYKALFFDSPLRALTAGGTESVIRAAGFAERDVVPARPAASKGCGAGGLCPGDCADPARCPGGACYVWGEECLPCPPNAAPDPADPGRCVCAVTCPGPFSRPNASCTGCECQTDLLSAQCEANKKLYDQTGGHYFACLGWKPDPSPDVCACGLDTSVCLRCDDSSRTGHCLECAARAECLSRGRSFVMNKEGCKCIDCSLNGAVPSPDRSSCVCPDEPCPFGSNRNPGNKCRCTCDAYYNFVPDGRGGCGCNPEWSRSKGGSYPYPTKGEAFTCSCDITCPEGMKKVAEYSKCYCDCADGYTRSGGACTANRCLPRNCPDRRDPVTSAGGVVTDCSCGDAG